MTGKKRILGILIAFLVAVSFVPITGQAAFAGESQNSFNAAGHVTGLAKASAEYNSVTIKWSAYKGAEGYQVFRANKKKGKYKKIATVKGCTFKDKGNKKLGKKKYYKVRAYGKVNSVTKYTPYSGVLAAKPKVGKPTGLTSVSGNGSVTLKWNKVAGATKYQVYRATSKTGKYIRLGTTKYRQYTNTSLTNGTKYFYKVRAYKKKRGKKRYGDFTASVEGMTRPGLVGGFNVALSGDGIVTGSWSKASGAIGYELQRTVSGTNNYVTVGETAALSLKDALKESGKYRYRIRSFAIVNGKRVYGDFSTGGRSSAVSQAQSWVGCRESNGSHKKIIDVYNKYNPKYGKIGYGTSWCAAFVSAVAIKTGNTGVIPVDCYCPRMINRFAKKTNNKKYTPQGGDVVFYDWNYNRVPDHVGMIESVSGNNVTAIEGNYSDAVKRRTFKKGYSLLLSYGLPDYPVNSEVSYTAPEKPTPAEDENDVIAKASVSETDILQACEEITATEEPVTEPAAEPEEPTEAVGSEAEAVEPEAEAVEPETEAVEAEAEAFASETETVAETAVEASAIEEEPAVEEPAESMAGEPAVEEAEPMTDVGTAEKIIEYIQEEDPAENESAEESAYNAVLVYGVCDEMDIDACVVTITDGSGESRSYNEVVLDGELYILDATVDGGVLEKYTPEEIN